MLSPNESQHEEKFQCFDLENPENATIQRHLYGTLLSTAALNGLTAPFTFFGNVIVVYILWKNTALRTTSNVLLGFLATSDTLVGLIVKPLYVMSSLWDTEFDSVYCSMRIAYASAAWLCCGVSFLTIDLITLDRYVALFYHRRYCTVFTYSFIRRVYFMFWVLCAVIVGLMFVQNVIVFRPIASLFLSLSFTFVLIAYIRVLKLARHHQRQIHQQERQMQRMYSVRQTKLAVTMGCVVGVYLTCYSPILAVILYQNFASNTNRSVRVVYNWAVTFALLSSTFNPLIYCWRCGNIRRVTLNTLKKCYCATHVSFGVSKVHVLPQMSCASAVSSRAVRW